MSSRIQTYITDHWKGRHSWLLVLFVNLFLVRVVLSILTGAFAQIPGFVAFAPIIVVNGIVVVWQVVGTKRSASRYLRNSSDMYSTLMVYVGLGGVLLLTALQGVDLLSERFTPEPTPWVLETPMLETVDGGQVVLITGDMSYPLNTALTLAANPGVKTALLQSDGGNIFAGRAVALNIVKSKLATRVDGHCYSACTLAFAAGHSRTLGPAAQLGFHGYAFDSVMRVQTLNVSEEEAKDRAFFRARGISDDFIGTVFEAPPDQLWIPTLEELLRAGVVTD